MRRPSGRRLRLAGSGNLRCGAALGDLSSPDGSNASIQGLFGVVAGHGITDPEIAQTPGRDLCADVFCPKRLAREFTPVHQPDLGLAKPGFIRIAPSRTVIVMDFNG